VPFVRCAAHTRKRRGAGRVTAQARHRANLAYAKVPGKTSHKKISAENAQSACF